MALVTRCSNPACLTLFRVTPAQLQAFGGQVRCGSCGTVFDAFPSLTTVADSALKIPAPAPAAAGPAGPASTGVAVQEGHGPGREQDATLVVPDNGIPEERDPAHPVAEAPARDALYEAVRAQAAVSSDPALVAETELDDADRRASPDAERVSEWTPDAPPPQVDAHSPPQPMAVDRVQDLPDDASLAFVATTADAPRDTTDALRDTTDAPRDMMDAPRDTTDAPAPALPAAAMTDPAPRFAPELTDCSVTAGPPPRSKPAAGRMRVVGITAGVLLAAAAAVLLLAGDRLPAPLAGSVAGVSAAPLLREHPVAVAVALLGLLCLMLQRYRATWIVASVLLAALLAGQALHAYRTQIAASYPASRPLLDSFCRIVQCEVGLPKAADQLVIESSDLQAVDAAKPNLIQLAASVRNRAAIDVAFPAIEVTLTDGQDRPLARRVLLPDQYLAGGKPARTGLRAGEAFSVRLTLDTTELRPAGYRLYLFYP